jgi:hypothetical protein
MEFGSVHSRSGIIETPLLTLHSSTASTTDTIISVLETAPQAKNETRTNHATSLNAIFTHDVEESVVPPKISAHDIFASFEEVKDVNFGDAITSRHWMYVVVLGLGVLLWRPCRISFRDVMQNALMVLVLCLLSATAVATLRANSVVDTAAHLALSLGLILQVIGFLVGAYSTSRRLRRRCKLYENEAYYPGFCAALACITITVVAIGAASFIFFRAQQSLAWLVFPVLSTLLSIGIGAASSFIFMDAFCANAILKEAINQLRSTMPVDPIVIETIANEVNCIVNNGFITNSAVTVVALMNVVIIFVIVVTARVNLNIVMGQAFVWLSKEVIFAVAILYSVACVNETSDELNREVGVQYFKLDAKNLANRQRLDELSQVLQYLMSNPVRFPIAGMILTRKDVALRFGIWGFGLLLSGVARVNWTE